MRCRRYQRRGRGREARACFDYYAEVGRRSYGNSIPPVQPHQVNFTIKEPYGVVAAIVPFNFPLLLHIDYVMEAKTCWYPYRDRQPPAHGSVGATRPIGCATRGRLHAGVARAPRSGDVSTPRPPPAMRWKGVTRVMAAGSPPVTRVTGGLPAAATDRRGLSCHAATATPFERVRSGIPGTLLARTRTK
ncbi:MAG: aldehyde dehydrogenase family protein [Gemmatimonadales bacterium]